MSKEKLIDLEHEQLGLVKVIIRRHIPGKTVWAYGSRVTWKASDISDLDLAVFGCSSAEVGDLKEAFEESSLLVSVGVMDWESNPEKFAESVGQRYVVVQRGLERWREVRLEDVAEKIAMGPFGSNIKVETFKTKGIPIISGQHLHETRLRDNKFNFISEEHADKLRNSNVFRGDVIFTHAGNIGQVSFIPKNSQFKRYVLSQRQFYLRCRKDKINYEFITYYFKSPYGQHQILANSSQTGVPSLAQPATFLKNLKITLPSLPDQKVIAEVLSSLDDKIDLLHRQNKTLEDMAQTLFRKWFVEDADERWEKIELGKLVKCITGHSYRSTELQPSNIALVTLKNFARDGSFRMDGYKEFVGKFKDSQIVRQGDLVVSHTDITQEADIIGNPALVVHPDKYDTLVITMDLMKVESAEKWLSKEFLFYLFKSRQFKSHCLGCSNGTTVLHMNRRAIPSYRFKIPNKEKVITFASTVKPKIDKIFNNISAIKTLEGLRDTILPKLMSGAVRVELD